MLKEKVVKMEKEMEGMKVMVTEMKEEFTARMDKSSKRFKEVMKFIDTLR